MDKFKERRMLQKNTTGIMNLDLKMAIIKDLKMEHMKAIVNLKINKNK